MSPLVGQAATLDGIAPNGKTTSASITIDAANSRRRIITIKLDPARGHAATTIVHTGLNERANATIPICALVSRDRIVHSVNAIACLRKSRRSSLEGASPLVIDRPEASLNHLIGPCMQHWRYIDPERFGSRKVDHEFKSRRL